jgi:hypothetical protein
VWGLTSRLDARRLNPSIRPSRPASVAHLQTGALPLLFPKLVDASGDAVVLAREGISRRSGGIADEGRQALAPTACVVPPCLTTDIQGMKMNLAPVTAAVLLLATIGVHGPALKP